MTLTKDKEKELEGLAREAAKNDTFGKDNVLSLNELNILKQKVMNEAGPDDADKKQALQDLHEFLKEQEDRNTYSQRGDALYVDQNDVKEAFQTADEVFLKQKWSAYSQVTSNSRGRNHRGETEVTRAEMDGFIVKIGNRAASLGNEEKKALYNSAIEFLNKQNATAGQPGYVDPTHKGHYIDVLNEAVENLTKKAAVKKQQQTGAKQEEAGTTATNAATVSVSVSAASNSKPTFSTEADTVKAVQHIQALTILLKDGGYARFKDQNISAYDGKYGSKTAGAIAVLKAEDARVPDYKPGTRPAIADQNYAVTTYEQIKTKLTSLAEKTAIAAGLKAQLKSGNKDALGHSFAALGIPVEGNNYQAAIDKYRKDNNIVLESKAVTQDAEEENEEEKKVTGNQHPTTKPVFDEHKINGMPGAQPIFVEQTVHFDPDKPVTDYRGQPHKQLASQYYHRLEAELEGLTERLTENGQIKSDGTYVTPGSDEAKRHAELFAERTDIREHGRVTFKPIPGITVESSLDPYARAHFDNLRRESTQGVKAASYGSLEATKSALDRAVKKGDLTNASNNKSIMAVLTFDNKGEMQLSIPYMGANDAHINPYKGTDDIRSITLDGMPGNVDLTLNVKPEGLKNKYISGAISSAVIPVESEYIQRIVHGYEAAVKLEDKDSLKYDNKVNENHAVVVALPDKQGYIHLIGGKNDGEFEAKFLTNDVYNGSAEFKKLFNETPESLRDPSVRDHATSWVGLVKAFNSESGAEYRLQNDMEKKSEQNIADAQAAREQAEAMRNYFDFGMGH